MTYIILTILGVAFGSFINALVWRTHHNRTTTAKTKKLSIVRGRSVCSHCHKQLAVKDLMPILSWLSLKGKCRYCKKPIPDTPLAELVTPLLFVVSYVFWPFEFDAFGWIAFGAWLAIITVAVALILYDFKWMTLPDSLNRALLLFAILFVLARTSATGLSTFFVAIFSSFLLFGFFYLLHKISAGQWIGGGDVKLAPSLGLIVGSPLGVFFVLFLSSLLGLLYASPQLLRGSLTLKGRIPFGPSLIIAMILVVLFQSDIATWLLASPESFI